MPIYSNYYNGPKSNLAVQCAHSAVATMCTMLHDVPHTAVENWRWIKLFTQEKEEEEQEQEKEKEKEASCCVFTLYTV